MPKSDLPFQYGDYAPVAERIALFYERYPTGRIITDLISRENREITVRASVYRREEDAQPAATGWAAERVDDGEINAVACLENTETSAIGRALANLGLTASRQRPSREEMEKAERARGRLSRRPTPAADARRPTAARDSAVGDALQERVDEVTDALRLVTIAERYGMPAKRRETIRRVLTSGDKPPVVVEEFARKIRRWLAQRRDRRLSAPPPDEAQATVQDPPPS